MQNAWPADRRRYRRFAARGRWDVYLGGSLASGHLRDIGGGGVGLTLLESPDRSSVRRGSATSVRVCSVVGGWQGEEITAIVVWISETASNAIGSGYYSLGLAFEALSSKQEAALLTCCLEQRPRVLFVGV